MKQFHMPLVNARYWTAITLASIFGTNSGDLYAHTAQLGIVQGVLVLCLLAAGVFLIERRDRTPHEIYYWLVIIIIRTGATNIADYLAFRAHIPLILLIGGLALIIVLLALRARAQAKRLGGVPGAMPDTDSGYWIAMLAAGVFGTALGDVCSHLVGQGVASLALGVALALVLLWRRHSAARHMVLGYWLTIAVVRTAGTAIGDWLAESPLLHIGLPLSTLITGSVFLAALSLLPRGRS